MTCCPSLMFKVSAKLDVDLEALLKSGTWNEPQALRDARWSFLLSLKDHGGYSLTELCHATGRSRSTLSDLLRRARIAKKNGRLQIVDVAPLQVEVLEEAEVARLLAEREANYRKDWAKAYRLKKRKGLPTRNPFQ